MNTHKKAAQTRFIVAISLFAAAIISALALTALGNQSQSYWIARAPLIPGSQITQADIALTRVALGESSSKYISSVTQISGSFLLRGQRAGELIAISDLSDAPPDQRTQQVPIAVRNADLPVDLTIGEAINIYWVAQSAMGAVAPEESSLVISGAFIRSIDRKSANFTSEVALTIALHDSQIINLLTATSSGRLVIVRISD